MSWHRCFSIAVTVVCYFVINCSESTLESRPCLEKCWQSLFVIYFSVVRIVAKNLTAEERLINDLFANYTKHARPVLNPEDKIEVTFGFELVQLVNVVSTFQSPKNVNLCDKCGLSKFSIERSPMIKTQITSNPPLQKEVHTATSEAATVESLLIKRPPFKRLSPIRQPVIKVLMKAFLLFLLLFNDHHSPSSPYPLPHYILREICAYSTYTS